MRLSLDQSDALAEVVNIGVGRAAASLSELIGTRIEIVVPTITVLDPRQAASALHQEKSTSIIQEFDGVVSGSAVLIFPRESGLALAQLLCDRDDSGTELDIELGGVLTEIGNIVLNCIMGSLANMLETQLTYSVPRLAVLSIMQDLFPRTGASGADRTGGGEPTNNVLLANARFKVAQRDISGSILIVFELGSIEQVLDTLLGKQHCATGGSAGSASAPSK